MKVDEKILKFLHNKKVDNVDNCICYLFSKTNNLHPDLAITQKDILISNTLLETDVGITDIAGVKLKQNFDIVNYDQIDVLVTNIRTLFKGIKPYSMGDEHDLKKKLIRFLKTYPQYTEEDILAATKYYLANTPEKFIRRANYFVFKLVDRSERSDLATALSEMKSKNILENVITWS